MVASFSYNPQGRESRRIQETLFHEKETIIENCLFGVDINPNSVKICRLRLWIELLKNAYYTTESGYTELETLPNIDINIKRGNSLVSRFALDADLAPALKTLKWDIDAYQGFVRDYKAAKGKEEKRALEALIDGIKKDFRTEIGRNDPKLKRLNKVSGEYELLMNQQQIFELSKAETKLRKATREKLEKEIAKLSAEVEEIKSNRIYEHAFEWRFEFPEVLDAEARFTGFDVVIGNPPYLPLESFSEGERDYFRREFKYFERKFESSVLFIVQGFNILKTDGELAYIAPITWQTGENYSTFRKYIFQQGINAIINLPFDVFPDAYVDTAIYFLSKRIADFYRIFSFGKKDRITSLTSIPFQEINVRDIAAPKYKLVLQGSIHKIIHRLKESSVLLGDLTISTQGLSASNFPVVENPDIEKHYPFLDKGRFQNSLLKVEECHYTSLDDKPSLKRFYEAGPKVLIRRIINRQDRLSVGYTEERMVFKKDINPFILTTNTVHPKFLLGVLGSKFVSVLYLQSVFHCNQRRL